MPFIRGGFKGTIISKDAILESRVRFLRMRRCITIFFCLFSSFIVQATHLRSGQITLKRQSGLTYLVTLKVYTNTGSEVRFGDGTLSFGDGSTPVTTPDIGSALTDSPNVGIVKFSVAHTFPGAGSFVISYLEPNLDAGILNISNSVETSFYLESKIIIESGRDNSSPDFLTDPFFRHPLGMEYSFSNEAADNNDYRLTYDLVLPLPPGKSNFTRPENININYYNGLVKWDTNFKGTQQPGEYLFAVRVAQYDKLGGQVGYVMRTFQVLLENVNSELSTITSIVDPNNKVFVEENKQRTVRAVLMDNALSNEVKWDVFYDNKIAANMTFSQHDSVAGSKKIKVGLLTLQSTSSIIRVNPYSITLRGTSTTSGGVFSKDISYLFFTKDIELPVVTAVLERPGNSINAYPNPFSNFLYVDGQSDVDECEFILMDITGKVIFSTKGKAGQPIDTSSLPTGLYILQIRNALAIHPQKLVKQ